MVAECGRSGQCNRQLRARVVVYLSLAICPFAGQEYEKVARLLMQLAWAKRCSWQVTDTAAISRARDRLGPGPLKALFSQVAKSPATQSTPRALYGMARRTPTSAPPLRAQGRPLPLRHQYRLHPDLLPQTHHMR